MARPLTTMEGSMSSISGAIHLFQAKIDNAPVAIPTKAVRELPRKPKTDNIKGAATMEM